MGSRGFTKRLRDTPASSVNRAARSLALTCRPSPRLSSGSRTAPWLTLTSGCTAPFITDASTRRVPRREGTSSRPTVALRMR